MQTFTIYNELIVNFFCLLFVLTVIRTDTESDKVAKFNTFFGTLIDYYLSARLQNYIELSFFGYCGVMTVIHQISFQMLAFAFGVFYQSIN